MGTEIFLDQNVSLLDIPEMKDSDLVIAYENKSTDNTGNYYVFVNAGNTARSFKLGDYDFSNGEIVVDNNEAGVKKVSKPSGFTFSKDALKVDPLTTIVIKVEQKKKKKVKGWEEGFLFFRDQNTQFLVSLG